MPCSQSSTSSARATFHLPIEITIEILSRLPVKSLLRFKSVCKNWYALIQSPNFIAKHLINQSKFSVSSLLAACYNGETDTYRMYLLSLNDPFDGSPPPISLDFPVFTGMSFVRIGSKSYFRIVGICDGLVCVSFSEYGIYPLILCNPATRSFRKIPHYEWRDLGFPRFRWISIGFGFHPSANDYKLVRIVNYYHLDPTEEFLFRADVHSMGSDTWSEIEVNMTSLYGEVDHVVRCNICVDYASAFVNGVFYWEADKYSDTFALSFDMGNEVIQTIQTPPCFNAIRKDKAVWQLTGFMDKLAAIVYADIRCFDVWVLNENGLSWTKHFKLGPFPRLASPVGHGEEDDEVRLRVVGFAKNGDIVMKDCTSSGGSNLFLYNPKSQQSKNFHFADVRDIYQNLLYTETLLPAVKDNEVDMTLKLCSTRRKRKIGNDL